VSGFGWRFGLGSVGALVACGISAAALAQEVSDRSKPIVRGTPYTFTRSDVRIVTSKAGADYRILISWPEEPPPASGYPILYFLDGDDYFATFAETANVMARNSGRGIMERGIVPGVVVGIGYPGESRRGLDYSPPGTPSLIPGRPAGGADTFLSFIANELRPSIEADVPIDVTRQTLMGQSAGGLFVLHVLYTRPELFQTYVAGSPALGFWDRPVLKGEEDLARKLRAADLRRSLFVTVGDDEEKVVVITSQSNILQEAKSIAGRLSAFEEAGLSVNLRVFSGENHFTSPLPLISHTLLHAFPVVAEGDR